VDREALENIKKLIITKSLEQGIDEDVALQHANVAIDEISRPDGTASYQLLTGLVVALMFDGESRDQQIRELILSIAPQVMPHLSADKQRKLESLVNEIKH
jgi:hypothetical protein